MLNSKRLVFVLFSISLLLVFANIFTKEEKSGNVPDEETETSGFVIDSIFTSTLNEFSIKGERIKKRKSPYKNMDSLQYSYTITLPSDLPIVSVLYYLKQNFDDQKIELFCREKKLNADSEIEIKSGNNIKLFAEIIINKNEFREFGNFSIYLTGVEKLETSERNILLKNSDPYSFILSPTQKSADITKEITESNKNFILLLTDAKVDDNFQLKTDFSNQRLLISIKNIVANFRKNPNILIDINSDLYNSISYIYIEKEFRKRGFKILPINSFVRIDQMTDEESISIFKQRIDNFGKTGSEVFILRSESYTNLNKTIFEFKKRGVKYTLPIN
ncbi:MAG: hypothetical protein Q8N03_14860 [Ignavibacteria bacterium]|nr:hypothetical protein [Ignavibacteria bacterium]